MPWTPRDAYFIQHYTYDPLSGVVYYDGRPTGSNCHGYLQVHNKYGVFGVHRLAWFLTHGYWPIEVNHKNGIKYNNWLSNLEEVTKRQNKQLDWRLNGGENVCIRERPTNDGKMRYFVQVKLASGYKASKTFKTLEAAKKWRAEQWAIQDRENQNALVP